MTSKKITFKDVQAKFEEQMLLGDKNIIRLVAATVLANQMPLDPVWLMIVSASSGGKSHIIGTIDGLRIDGGEVDTVTAISDVTENTFASGFKRNDKESSLLHRIPVGGLMIMKDFTTILSKRREAKEMIMAQFREIYDGKYDKHTGTGDNIGWKGKIGVIAGVTEAVYEHLESLSVMGDRFIMYSMEQPDRLKLIDFVLKAEQDHTISKKHQYEELSLYFQTYLYNAKQGLSDATVTLDEESQDDIKAVADFCTKARSGVVEDFRTGAVKFVPSKEMPTRMIKQLLAIASGLLFIRQNDGDVLPEQKGKLLPGELKILYKLAFDSIPIKRRIALQYLTRYSQGVITEGLAMKLNYQTDVIRGWLSQLNALGLVKRVKDGAKDKWILSEENQDIMRKFNDIKTTDETLYDDGESADEAYEQDEADAAWEASKVAQDEAAIAADNLFESI